MTTSNSTDFNLVTNEIVEEAFREIGVLTSNRILTSEEMNDGRRSLNLFTKSLIAQGSFLWKTESATLFTAPTQAKYIIDGSTANCTEEFTETTTSAAAAISATNVVVTSASGFVVGYFIGIILSDNSFHWTTISNIASTTITLTDALPSASVSGSTVIVYQTKLSRPERIQNAQSSVNRNQEIPLTLLSRDTYDNLTTKQSAGTPNQLLYDKQLTSGVIYLWPVPNSSAVRAKFTFTKQIFDFDSATDDPDFPVEWLHPIILNVAYRLCRKYGALDLQEKEQLKRDADEALADSNGYDREDTSMYFQPATNTNQSTYR
tara:strand:- start:2914 stop:3870 length:957 start_codon:yes stop_codon:yes gene_type:complete